MVDRHLGITQPDRCVSRDRVLLSMAQPERRSDEARPTPRVSSRAQRLQLLADELLIEAQSTQSPHLTRDLPEPVSGLSQMLIVLTGSCALQLGDAPTEGSLHLVRGRARLIVGRDTTELTTDGAPLPREPHAVHSDAAAVILRSVVLPAQTP
jgi:hypothetical protein